MQRHKRNIFFCFSYICLQLFQQSSKSNTLFHKIKQEQSKKDSNPDISYSDDSLSMQSFTSSSDDSLSLQSFTSSKYNKIESEQFNNYQTLSHQKNKRNLKAFDEYIDDKGTRRTYPIPIKRARLTIVRN